MPEEKSTPILIRIEVKYFDGSQKIVEFLRPAKIESLIKEERFFSDLIEEI